MRAVLHLRKELIAPPVAVTVPGVHLRTFAMSNDLERWLALRDGVMAGQLPTVRSWTDADFYAEMASKSWWQADRTWLACRAHEAGDLIGAVTLAVREGKVASLPVVHWLLVDPKWRRRGIGRM